MIAYLIQMDSGDSLPLFYNPEAGRNTGHGSNGWSQEKNAGLGFATQHDAQRFIDHVLPRTGAGCRPVLYQRPD